MLFIMKYGSKKMMYSQNFRLTHDCVVKSFFQPFFFLFVHKYENATMLPYIYVWYIGLVTVDPSGFPTSWNLKSINAN